MNSDKLKKRFIYYGIAAYISVSIWISFAVYAALVQKGKLEALVIFGIDIYQVTMYLIFAFIAISFAFGWVAVLAGRKINCTVCGESILTADGFGFRSLAVSPLIRLIRGKQICSNCFSVK